MWQLFIDIEENHVLRYSQAVLEIDKNNNYLDQNKKKIMYANVSR